MQRWLDQGAFLSLNSTTVLLGFGECRKDSRLRSTPSFYCPDFFLEDQTPFLSYSFYEIIDVKILAGLLENMKMDPQWCEPNWKKFEYHFETTQALFIQNILKKTVPYVSYSSCFEISNKERMHLLKSAITFHLSFPETFLYGYWDATAGILGVTPEVLFKKNKNTNRIETMACAGTVPSEAASLLKSDPKLIQEHETVIQGIVEKMESLGKVSVLSRFNRSYGKIVHSMTPIVIDLKKEIDFLEIIKKIHPTPALGVYPLNEKGWEWLRNYALDFPRHSFGAPFGAILNQEEAIFYVAIRGIEWIKNQIKLSVGCGINEKSQFLLEKKEIELKFQTVRDQLKI